MSTTFPSLRALSDELRALVSAASAVTVSISGRRQRPTTGTIVAAERVVAIHHVLGSDSLTVRTDDGRTLDATVTGRDDTRDLALLTVPGLDGRPLPQATEPARVGDLVVGVSRDWHGEPAASLGLVGAVGGPVRMGRATIERIIRADIGSTKGISGSPLVNAAGQIVGILNAGVARGVPLALPMDEVERSVQALAVHGRIRRGFLGVALQPVVVPSRQHAGGEGLLVVGVEANGPADHAGLLVGDVVVAAAGEPTAELEALHRRLGSDRIGSAIDLDVLRGAQVSRVSVIVGERPAGPGR